MNNTELHWEITNACNLKCRHCLLDAGNCLNDEMNFQECLDALKKIKKAGIESICFTGGEPFCKKDFRILLERALELRFNIQIVTNGTLLDKEWLDFLKLHNISLGISLDGHNSEYNDYIRGEGTYEKIITVLKECQKRNMQFYLYITATKTNMDNLEKIFAIINKYDCKGIHINDLTVGGRHESNSTYVMDTKMKENMITLINEASIKVFDEEIKDPNKSCWVSNDVILMTSSGELYHCTEVKRLMPERSFGNIRKFPLKRWIKDNTFLNFMDRECCYYVYFNSKISVTKNESVPCIMINTHKRINTLTQLYDAFDKLNTDCQEHCIDCVHPDCKGYIWLTEKEVNRLYENHIDVIEVNNRVNFIHSFYDESGEINMLMKQPQCVHRRDSGECEIYDLRPLVCHMYPIGPETMDKTNVWVLHDDCAFSRKMIEDGTISDYIRKAKMVFSSISNELKREINSIYSYVDYLSNFPNGENSCIIIEEMKA